MHQVIGMNQKTTGMKERSGERRLPALGGAFLVGALAGSLCCTRLQGLQTAMLERGQAGLTLWQVLWPELTLLLVMLLSGFLRAGCLTALLTMAVKGFFLSAGSTAQVLKLGNLGYGAALAQVLLPGFFAVAALILLGRQAMGWAVERLRFPPGRGKQIRPDSAYFLTAAICAVLMVLSALIAVRLAPSLWGAVQSFLPTT